MRALQYTAGSPFARAVRILLDELDLDYVRRELQAAPAKHDSETSPTMQVPTFWTAISFSGIADSLPSIFWRPTLSELRQVQSWLRRYGVLHLHGATNWSSPPFRPWWRQLRRFRS